jgi:YVTN family beta-propeller protein
MAPCGPGPLGRRLIGSALRFDPTVRWWAAAVLFVWVALLTSAAWASPFAYIPNAGDRTVSVIDTATNTVTATLSLGLGPVGVAVSPEGTRVYVSLLVGFVSVIDTTTNTVVATVPVGSTARGIAVSPTGHRLYVANVPATTTSWRISTVDTATNTVVATVAVGDNSGGVVATPEGTRVYVASGSISGFVSIIDTGTNTVVATVPVGSRPDGVAVNSSGTRIYVANGGSDDVSVIDTATNTVVATVPVGSAPQGVAVDPTDTRVYVTNNKSTSNSVSVLDAATNTVVATVPVGNTPVGVAVTPAGTRAYVANAGSASVSVLDTATNTVVATVPVGNSPVALGIFITPSLLRLSASVNQSVFATGQTLTAAVGLTNPGLAGAADFYVGALLPDGNTIVFLTGTGLVVGTVANLASFAPIASGVSLATPFEVNLPGLFTYEWTGTESPGRYVFFSLAVKAGAFVTGGVAEGAILSLATATFSFP